MNDLYAIIDEHNTVINLVMWDGVSEPDQFGAGCTPIVVQPDECLISDDYDPATRTFTRGLPLPVRRRRQQAELLKAALAANADFLTIDQPTAAQVRAQTEALTEQCQNIVALIVDQSL